MGVGVTHALGLVDEIKAWVAISSVLQHIGTTNSIRSCLLPYAITDSIRNRAAGQNPNIHAISQFLIPNSHLTSHFCPYSASLRLLHLVLPRTSLLPILHLTHIKCTNDYSIKHDIHIS